MAHNPKLTDLAANTSASAAVTLLNSGKIAGYTGSQPATANTAITSQVKLFQCTCNATAGGAPTAGVVTFNSITSDTNAANSGTCTWFRAYQSDGTTPVFDGAVGTSSSDLNLTTTTIVAAATVSISSFTYTQGKG